MFTRWAMTLGTAALAEFAAHWLSLGWGFMTLLAGFVFVAVHVTAGVASVASKAVTTEARVNALVPVVNTVNDTANSAQSTANNAMPKSGGTFTGGVDGPSFHASGVIQADNGFNVSGTTVISSGTAFSGASIHVSGTAQADSGFNVSGNTVISSGRAFSGASIHVSGSVLADNDCSFSSMNGQSLPEGALSASDGTLASTASLANGLRSRIQGVGIIP